MRFAIVGLALLVAPVGAHAQESRVVDACIAAFTHGAAVPKINPVVVQDFSQLSPPRAVVTFTVDGVGTPRPFKGTCKFASAESPLELLEFCVEDGCYTKDGGSEKFAEVQLLLQRDGF